MPESPRATNKKRSASRKAPCSLGPTSRLKTSRCTHVFAAIAITAAMLRARLPLADFGNGRILSEIRVRFFEFAGTETFDLRIQSLTQPRALALTYHGHPQRLKEIINSRITHKLDVRPLHHRDECLSRSLSGSRQTYKVALVIHLRPGEPDGAHTGVPRAFPAAVAVPSSLSGLFVPIGAHMLAHFQFHQFLGEHP